MIQHYGYKMGCICLEGLSIPRIQLTAEQQQSINDVTLTSYI